MSTKIVARALVIIAVVAAVTVVATGGVLSVKPAYAINPGWGSCTDPSCPTPAASGFTPGASAQKIEGVPANTVAPGQLGIPGIEFRSTIP